MQHAVDLHRGDRRTLQRRQQHAAQRIAERRAEAALQRLGDERRHAPALAPGRDFKLSRPDEFLPILLIYCIVSSCSDLDRRRGCRVLVQLLVERSVAASGNRSSDAAALGRPAAIVRNGRHVADRRDLEAAGLQRPQCRIRGPSPGPLTSTSTVFMPCSMAARPACSAATWAA